MIQYLQGSRLLALTLEADNVHFVKWWVDAAFAVTSDMQSQSGGMMTLGRDSLYCSSLQQRLNTRSSTEVKTFSAKDFIPQLL